METLSHLPPGSEDLMFRGERRGEGKGREREGREGGGGEGTEEGSAKIKT